MLSGLHLSNVGLVSAIGTDFRYDVGSPGIESRWRGVIFFTRPHCPWGPPSLLHNGYRVIPTGKAAEACH